MRETNDLPSSLVWLLMAAGTGCVYVGYRQWPIILLAAGGVLWFLDRRFGMNDWFERRWRRQSDLARGVDADLVRDNRKRFKNAFILMGLGLLLSALVLTFQIPDTVNKILFVVAFFSFLVGFVFFWWARAENSFLNNPDPEEPPKLIK